MESRTHAPGDGMRVVAKFGGTSLGSGDRINRAADSIAMAVEKGHEVAVVASAMGNTTDELLGDIEYEADDSDRAEIVSMGERTSVRMLKGALASRGIDAMFLEPGSEGGRSSPTSTARSTSTRRCGARTRSPASSERRPRHHWLPRPGPAGQRDVTTLGRGGSDTTAVMLGNYMDADEVVIVTDVEGRHDRRPRVVEGARNVGKISVDELRSLSFRGAEVVAPSALSYKGKGIWPSASSTTSTATCSPAAPPSRASSRTSSTSRRTIVLCHRRRPRHPQQPRHPRRPRQRHRRGDQHRRQLLRGWTR